MVCSKAGCLNQGLDFWGQVNLCCGGQSCTPESVQQGPDPCSLDAGDIPSISQCDNQNHCQSFPGVSEGQNCPEWEALSLVSLR